VDIRVAQELKNDKDFKYSIGQSVQKLENSINALHKIHEQNVATSHSDRKAVLIQFENLKESVMAIIKDMNNRLRDTETKMFEVLDSFNEMQEEVITKYLTKQEFLDVHIPQVNKLNSIHRWISDRDNTIGFELATMKDRFKQDLEALKRDLTPIVPEKDPIQHALDERFKVLKVDFDGLIKEIELLKRAVAYDQKRFENVYTLIERLKGGTH
jgi:hypothetical protein